VIASRRKPKRQAVLEGRRLARKIVKGFSCLGVPSHALPDVNHLEAPKHYIAVDDSGVPAIEIRTPKAHALHLTQTLRKVNELRAAQRRDPNRKMAKQVMEALAELGNPADQARRAHKMRDVQWMQDHVKKLEEELGESGTDEQANAKEERRQLSENDGGPSQPGNKAKIGQDNQSEDGVFNSAEAGLPRDAMGAAATSDEGV